MNKLIFSGNTTKDIIVRKTAGENPKSVATITIGNNENKTDGGEATFLDVEIWGVLAENCAKFVGKGSLVQAEGRFVANNYKKEGVMQYSVKFVGSGVEWLNLKDPGAVEKEKQ